MRHRRTALAVIAAAALLTTACGSNTVSGSPTNMPELPAVTTDTTTAPTPEPVDDEPATEPSLTEPERNERGNLELGLGDLGGWGPINDPMSPQGVTFAIDKIEVDPGCDAYGTPPENGHTIVLHVRVATGTDAMHAGMVSGVLNPYSFAVLGSDGVTKPVEMGMCTDPNKSLTMNTFGPNQKYTGLIELIGPEPSGTLVLTAPMAGGGWEWKY